MGAIARALGRAKATISRELQRNALPSGGYSPLHAAVILMIVLLPVILKLLRLIGS